MSKPLTYYVDWINARFPAEMRERAQITPADFAGYGELRGLTFWMRGADAKRGDWCDCDAKDEDEMCRYLYGLACRYLEPPEKFGRGPAEEKKRWRWTVATKQAVPDTWPRRTRTIYHEREDYEYNTIYQRDLARYEVRIALLGAVLPEEAERLIAEGERALNRPYAEPHWAWDRARGAYVEISDSRQRDAFGRELPLPEDVVRL